jgi:hypothetical protein
VYVCTYLKLKLSLFYFSDFGDESYMAAVVGPPAPTFNLSSIEDEVRELSQKSETGDEFSEFEIPCSQPRYTYSEFQNVDSGTPPDSDEPQYVDLAQIGGEEFKYTDPYYADVGVGTTGTTINASGQSQNFSSQESSQGDKLIALTDFAGKYNFSVEPVEKHGKKCLFSVVGSKIFCQPEVEIEFKFDLDFDVAPVKKLHVDAMLLFSSNDHRSTPVNRCNSCFDNEIKTSGRIDEGEIEIQTIYVSVNIRVRCWC